MAHEEHSLREATIRSTDEAFLPFASPRAEVPDATLFRSTWLSSSLTALRDRGLMDRYLSLLPSQYHAPITESVAGMWFPTELCMAHYRACDGLQLSKADRWDVGTEVTRKVHGTSIALAFRLATHAGVTPWTILSQLYRMWARVWVGGGVAVYKRGPKEAVVEVIRWRPATIPYVQDTMPAVIASIVAMFCTRAYVSVVPSLASSSSMGLKLQWA